MSNYLGCRRRRTQGRREAWRNTKRRCWNQGWTSCCCSSSRRKGGYRRTIWTNTKQNPYYYCISIFGSCCTYIVYCIPTSICQCWSIKKKTAKSKAKRGVCWEETPVQKTRRLGSKKNTTSKHRTTTIRVWKRKWNIHIFDIQKAKDGMKLGKHETSPRISTCPSAPSIALYVTYFDKQVFTFINIPIRRSLPPPFYHIFLAFWHQLLHQSKQNHTISIK